MVQQNGTQNGSFDQSKDPGLLKASTSSSTSTLSSDKSEDSLPPKPPRGKGRDKRPTVDELIEAIPSDLPDEYRPLAIRFAKARQSYVPATKRFGTVNAFELQCNRMREYPVEVVAKAVEDAMAGEWKSWEQESIKPFKQSAQLDAFAGGSF